MRRASIILALASILGPAALFGEALLESEREIQARGGPICGMPLFASFMLSSLLCVVLSAVAFVVGIIAFRRVAAPRPRRRVVELLALLLPLVVVGGYLATLLCGLR
jgi:hypothetical protein